MLGAVITGINNNVTWFYGIKRIRFCSFSRRYAVSVISKFKNKAPTLDGIFKTVAAASSVPTASAVMRAGFIRPTVGIVGSRTVIPILSVRELFHKFVNRQQFCFRRRLRNDNTGCKRNGHNKRHKKGEYSFSHKMQHLLFYRPLGRPLRLDSATLPSVP